MSDDEGCGTFTPHPAHDCIRVDGEWLTQAQCNGVPEPPKPLHGHGGGPHPDACFQCWWEVHDGW